jgi:hypothetical protein
VSLSTDKIVEKFGIAQNALVLQQSDLSLQSVSDMVENESIDISPKYQRRERWDIDKESGLIESFLLNIPVPPIYLAEDEYGTYSVIDGKQRVTAIHKFLKNKLALKNLDKFKELEGLTFNQLPLPLTNALKIRPYLRVVTLLRQSDPDLKHEVFLRLNKAGVALNSQEIRNVAYRGEFNDLLFSLSESPYLVQQLGATKDSKVYREMTDVQYVLRYFTVLAYWNSFPGNMDLAMDKYMRDNYRNPKKKISEQKRQFESSLAFCEQIWGKEGFIRPESSKRVLQGIFDIEMICCALLTDAQRQNAINKKKEVKKGLVELLNKDQDFMESVTQFTQNAKNVFYRIDRFTKLLKAI